MFMVKYFWDGMVVTVMQVYKTLIFQFELNISGAKWK